MPKQIIIICDMEGASGLFERNIEAIKHGSIQWSEYGRSCLTSDVLAVCEAAIEFGIEDILIYDGHYAGNPEPNIMVERLPKNVRFFDTLDRCFFWRRIRGQAQIEPLGLITVGQHARFGEKGAYFPHTIQTPPIKATFFNGFHIAEIGHAVLNFIDVRYIANVGCRASMKEALEMSNTVCTISVKDKKAAWEPSPAETFPIIKGGIVEALRNLEHFNIPNFEAPFEFSMSLTEGFRFITPQRMSWKGSFKNNEAFWEAPSIEIGLELFCFVRDCIVRDES